MHAGINPPIFMIPRQVMAKSPLKTAVTHENLISFKRWHEVTPDKVRCRLQDDLGGDNVKAFPDKKSAIADMVQRIGSMPYMESKRP
jgi:hypothetical protein